MKVHITNPELFHALRVEADLWDTNEYGSTIRITWFENDQLFHQELDGEFGQFDFVQQFGFELK